MEPLRDGLRDPLPQDMLQITCKRELVFCRGMKVFSPFVLGPGNAICFWVVMVANPILAHASEQRVNHRPQTYHVS